MICSRQKKWDTMPELSLGGPNNIEIVEKTKLLGVMVNSELTWNDNTNLITKKGHANLWTIRRLRNIGAKTKNY